jgi:hypothetical protein
MSHNTPGYVQVSVDHLRHLETFLNRMVEQGTHVHAKCWALVAAIPDENDDTSVTAPPVASQSPTATVQELLSSYDSLPVTISEPIYNEDGFGVGFRVVHPPGVECVFPLPSRQCSCGRLAPGTTIDGDY